MSRRRGSLFPRTLGDVVKKATQPLMDQQGKLYGALLRDWAVIVGPERARTTRPQCLKWPSAQADGAVLHLDVAAAIAPELAYETEQLLEKCARYFGYRAIARVVIHPNHSLVIPAKAGTQPTSPMEGALSGAPHGLDSRLRGNDGKQGPADPAKSPRERREAVAQDAQAGAATKNNHIGSPADMMDILQRMRQRIAGGDKRD